MLHKRPETQPVMHQSLKLFVDLKLRESVGFGRAWEEEKCFRARKDIARQLEGK